MKPEQGVDERRFACPVRAKQPDAMTAQSALNIVEDAPLSEDDSQLIKLNDWICDLVHGSWQLAVGSWQLAVCHDVSKPQNANCRLPTIWL
jgi:hypothetical protein